MVVIQWDLNWRVKRLVAGPNVSKNIVRHEVLAALTAGNTLEILPAVASFLPPIHTSQVLQVLLRLDVVLLEGDLGQDELLVALGLQLLTHVPRLLRQNNWRLGVVDQLGPLLF